jgi:hypothetical protein
MAQRRESGSYRRLLGNREFKLWFASSLGSSVGDWVGLFAMQVLVEGPSRTDPSRLRGRTRHNKVVNFAGLAQPGEYVDVEIHEATSQTLLGEQASLLVPVR